LGLNIAVLCTYGVILQMICYKYQAALPQLNTRMFSVSDGSSTSGFPDVFCKYLMELTTRRFRYKLLKT